MSHTCLFPLLFSLANAAGKGSAALHLSINGLPLSGRPFIDRSFQWPPILSWTIHDDIDRDVRQQGYAVLLDGVAVGGRTTADMQHAIVPAHFNSNELHDVALSVHLEGGGVMKEVGQFRTALLDGFGNASWISGGTLLRRQLTDLNIAVPAGLPRPTVVNATAFASGVGCFAMRLDGQLVSNSFMDPGWANLPTKRIPYRAFDLTQRFNVSNLVPSELRVALGMCKYGYQGSFCVGAHAANANCKAFLMSLRVVYSDGSIRTVVTSATDGAWTATTSGNPIQYSHLYHGEQYDGRVYDTPAQWRPATVAMFDTGEGNGGAVPASKALGAPTLLTMPALETSRRYSPVSIHQVGGAAVRGAPVFIRCLGKTNPLCGDNIFYEDTSSGSRHHVPECTMCGLNPCQDVRTITPAAVAALRPGPEFNCSMVPHPAAPTRWVFDMGNNMAGFATLRLKRSAIASGQPVTLQYAEVLKADGSADMAWCAELSGCKCSGINCANQTDTFIPVPAVNSSDDELLEYTPSFTYHGFRYVQVGGLAGNYVPTTADLTGLFVHSAVDRTGNVTFSHPVLDGIQDAVVQTQLSNLHFHPTDCPQREKRGWTGDAQFTSRQASLNFNMRQLYGNWLQTMADHDQVGCAVNGAAPAFPQTNKDICCNPKHGSFGCDFTGVPNGTFTDTAGSVADVVPFMYVGGWPGDPSWGSIASVLPYTVWKGGDDVLVEQFYAVAKRNVDFFIREASDDGLIEFGYYGDWLSIGHTEKPQVTALAQIMSTGHLAAMAAHLGKTSDAATYSAAAARQRTAYHTKYWDTNACSYKGGSQTANLMPLILGIPPPADRAKAAEAFVAKVQAAGNATSSGLVGASFVLQALVEAGRGDIALSMAMREAEPSWGYMVKQGPGTIWESWQDKTNSHNHPMFTASIGPYLYSIAGLDPTKWSIPEFLRRRRTALLTATADEITVHVTPDPHAVRVLGQAAGTVNTMCGPLSVEWQSIDQQYFSMAARIPHNCGRARLELHVPDGISAADRLCLDGRHPIAAPDADANSYDQLPRNVFDVRAAATRKTVDVIVGGGRTKLKLGRCI